LIDNITVDVNPIKAYLEKANNSVKTEGNNILKKYKKDVKDLMEQTEGLNVASRSEERKSVKDFQLELIAKLNGFDINTKKMIVAVWAVDTYGDNKSPFDSHLFIDDIKVGEVAIPGTFNVFMEVLQDCAMAKRVEIAKTDEELFDVLIGDRKIVEKYISKASIDTSDMPHVIRVWRSRPEITVASMFEAGTNILVEGKEVLINNTVYNLGDKTPIASGEYYIVEVREVKDKSGKTTITTGVDLVVRAI
jgi:hypothetical protein